MSSLQERLQLKRVPLDTWNTREQLCLASAVVRSGDQNWMSVSRALKSMADPNRPSDWFSQKSCAAQYGALLEHVETPKRKKRNSEGAGETPQESILKRLTQERIAEIQKSVAEINQQYQTLKAEVAEIKNTSTPEERLRELWTAVENAKRVREREQARRAAWLREREERRAKAERLARPIPTPVTAASTTPSSPLLTSLLKSSPVVTTPQHMSHPATVVETVSPSASAPTISMLLEKTSPTVSPHENKHAAIEHIKSQLVQIEQQLKANPSTPPITPLVEPQPPPVDLDDIVIKDEDVYAFRDVDIEIPPVAAMHKPPSNRPVAKPMTKKEEETQPQENQEQTATEETVVKVESEPVEDTSEDVPDVQVKTEESSESNRSIEVEVPESQPSVQDPVKVEEVTVSFPEVKFPTTEIKVIQHVEEKEKEPVPIPELPPIETVTEKEPNVEEERTVEKEPVQESTAPEPEVEQPLPPEPETRPEEPKQEEIKSKEEEVATETPQQDIIDNNTEEVAAVVSEATLEVQPEPETTVEEATDNTAEKEPVTELDTLTEVAEENTEDNEEDKSLEDIKKEVELEESTPLKEIKIDAEDKSKDRLDTDDVHTETDDDTPMEVIREEEKDGKKKRDYSRKKKPDSRTCSGSESAETSAPDSPTVSDAERQHRLWKKSVMLVYNRLAAHKYASLFLRPITDSEAPGYSMVVKRPMDLSTVKKNIDNGVIRTTAEFQRDVLLMLTNALMYNSSEHRVYQMAKEMFNEAASQLGMLLAAQAHAGLKSAPARRAPRRSLPEPPTKRARLAAD